MRLRVLSSFRYLLLVFVSLILFLRMNWSSTAQVTTNLGTVASSMQPGTWAELTNMNGWKMGAGYVIDERDGTNVNILVFADKAVWDPVNRRLLFQGGPHQGTSRAVQYDEQTNAWT